MRLNGIFKDDMVFQRDAGVRIFGETTPGAGVVIKATIKNKSNRIVLKGETSEIYEDGFFVLELPALPKGGPYTLKVEAKGEKQSEEDKFFDRYPSKQIFSNVYFGEVWIAAGQSNMAYPLMRTELARRDVPKCPDTMIHFYNVPEHGVYDELQRKEEDESSWSVINKETCGNMSGVAYYFARKIEKYIHENNEEDADLHFGIIGCYSGGSSVSGWQSVDSLKKTKEGSKYLEAFSEACSSVSEDIMELTSRQYKDAWLGYQAKIDRVLKQNPYTNYVDMARIIGDAPWPPPDSPTSIRRPGALFDTMVLRIVPFSVRGVIFYQGEEDCEEYAMDYAVVFKTMIENWREAFWNENLPFIFCQLPMYISKDKKYMGYDDYKWPKLRAQQEIVSKIVPDTYMAVLADCGEFDNVHPSDKKTPGNRLAQLALRFIYGFTDIPAVAPYAIDVRRGEGVEITFSGDFEMLSLVTQFAVDETGFELAGEDGEFLPAQASVDFDGKTVILTNPLIEYPMKVRYAYFSYGLANLVSDTGLAAAPFEAIIDRSIGEFY